MGTTSMENAEANDIISDLPGKKIKSYSGGDDDLIFFNKVKL